MWLCAGGWGAVALQGVPGRGGASRTQGSLSAAVGIVRGGQQQPSGVTGELRLRGPRGGVVGAPTSVASVETRASGDACVGTVGAFP